MPELPDVPPDAPSGALPADPLAALPDDRLYQADAEMWVRLDGDEIRCGATHLASQHGDFLLFTPKPAGTEVAAGRSLGVVETGKALIAVHAPVSGRIIEANAAAVARPGLINTAPYDAGWLFRLQPTAWLAEQAALLTAAAYREHLKRCTTGNEGDGDE